MFFVGDKVVLIVAMVIAAHIIPNFLFEQLPLPFPKAQFNPFSKEEAILEMFVEVESRVIARQVVSRRSEGPFQGCPSFL